MNLGLGMNRNQTHHRRRIAILCLTLCMVMSGLTGRLIFLMVFRSSYYSQKAEDLHQRERTIKAARGRIMDRNGVVLADNRTVCTISVIHNQVEDTEQVTTVLSELLAMPQEEIRKKVEKYSSREIIRTNVDKETGDQIRQQHLAGVKVDEDYKRYYPYDSLASKVLGFTGGDNQGIIGLEVKYEEILKGKPGKDPHYRRCQRRGTGCSGRNQRRPCRGQQPGSEPGCKYPGICPAGSIESNGRKTGRKSFDSFDESAKRRDLRLCQCTGIRSE